MPEWHDSPFTGLFTRRARIDRRPHDPAVEVTSGETPGWLPGEADLGGSGAGWTREQADAGCLGEAVERLMARALPADGAAEASWAAWPLDEPAVRPDRFVLFHPGQYARPGFPFRPIAPDTVCRWVCCREAATGEPAWVPEELVYLVPRPGECQRHTPGLSTGLSCGRAGDPVLLRGVQEVIERDALVGGWWGRYAVEEWPGGTVWPLLGAEVRGRVDRPNLRYRFYRVATPFGRHVTMVSLAGEDFEGEVFSVGSACRETRRESWLKSVLEAVQGRHCVRRLMATRGGEGRSPAVPTTFFEHALYHALHPAVRATTVLERAAPPAPDPDDLRPEGLAALRDRLGPDRPVLFRNLTPPGLSAHFPEWLVLRVVVPGLQPLHGDHRLPFLGGPLWHPRAPDEWSSIPPHPFA